MTRSLKTRLILASSVVLIAFLSATGYALERAFRDSGLALVQDRLQTEIYGLLAVAELDASDRLSLPEALPDERLMIPESGLYGQVRIVGGDTVWRSGSMLGLEATFPPAAEPGVAVFEPTRASNGDALYALSFAVTWDLGSAGERQYVFSVAEAQSNFAAVRERFRRTFAIWLAGAAVLLLVVQGWVLGWTLKPLRGVAAEIKAIEAGRQQRLSARYPRELLPLTSNLNELIAAGQRRLERHRNTIADLAHSLKTPLSVLRAAAERSEADLRDTVLEQVQAMDRAVQYQTSRASASGHSVLAPLVQVAAVVERVKRALAKVYAAKEVQIAIEVSPELRFHGDEDDLMEITGNLLDNACKWSRAAVCVRASTGTDNERGLSRLVLEVEDDGPGVRDDRVEAILQRGVREDTTVPGQGIGLAVVHDLVTNVYRGTVQIEQSDLGGARVRICLPQPTL